jgi:hypothetical protein
VQLATKWEQNYNIKSKAMDALRSELRTRQEIQQLTDAEFAKFQKQVEKLSKANNRWKAVVWVLAGYGLASTVVAAVLIGTK